jgi:hypothetical protein
VLGGRGSNLGGGREDRDSSTWMEESEVGIEEKGPVNPSGEGYLGLKMGSPSPTSTPMWLRA